MKNKICLFLFLNFFCLLSAFSDDVAFVEYISKERADARPLKLLEIVLDEGGLKVLRSEEVREGNHLTFGMAIDRSSQKLFLYDFMQGKLFNRPAGERTSFQEVTLDKGTYQESCEEEATFCSSPEKFQKLGTELVFDSAKSKLYMMRKLYAPGSSSLLIYNWDAPNNTLTFEKAVQLKGLNTGSFSRDLLGEAFGVALAGKEPRRLYILGSDRKTISSFLLDQPTWEYRNQINLSRPALSLGLDEDRGFLYLGLLENKQKLILEKRTLFGDPLEEILIDNLPAGFSYQIMDLTIGEETGRVACVISQNLKDTPQGFYVVLIDQGQQYLSPLFPGLLPRVKFASIPICPKSTNPCKEFLWNPLTKSYEERNIEVVKKVGNKYCYKGRLVDRDSLAVDLE